MTIPIQKCRPGNSANVDVTICCMVYNQKNYVVEMIESLLSQKASCKFQIIIHDDCSTDGTDEILKAYKRRHPDKIELILQEENKWGNGEKIFYRYILPLVKSEYVAFCDGDDYWTDNFKIQKQYEELEKYREVDLCFHPCVALYGNNSELIKTGYEQRRYSTNEIFKMDLHFIETSSLFVRVSSLKYTPDFRFDNSPVEDIYVRSQAIARNGAVCITNDMSVYRVMSVGSWTSANSNFRKKLGIIASLERSFRYNMDSPSSCFAQASKLAVRQMQREKIKLFTYAVIPNAFKPWLKKIKLIIKIIHAQK